jgi:septal ring factor EnvC (AmiA/AmiB activator)
MPAILIENDIRDGGYRYCPNGHQVGWSKDESETAKLRRERDRLKQSQVRLEQERAEAWAVAERAQKECEKARKVATKLKTRAAAGTCPCCNRTVSQMAKHMKTKHPTFKAEAA